jgi:hypothetical protein
MSDSVSYLLCAVKPYDDPVMAQYAPSNALALSSRIDFDL